jgi:adenine phosphoribosyltransferase
MKGAVSADVAIGPYEDAAAAARGLAGVPAERRAAVLPRAALDDASRVLLREADLECITTLDGGTAADAEWLSHELVATLGWRHADGPQGAPAVAMPGDVIGWYELRIASSALTTDRPITRLHGQSHYIASFNLMGQGRLNQACGELLYRRLVDEGIAPVEIFDVVVCLESKAVGMAQVLVESFGLDRYVVLRKGVKNYMPRRPRPPLVEEASNITSAGPQTLVLDPLDWPLLAERRALLVDDVIVTGSTVRAACGLLARAGAAVVATATVLLKGPEPEVPRLIALARPLL